MCFCLDPPVFITEPGELISCISGESLTLECQVMNADKIEWYFKDTKISKGNNIKIKNAENGVSKLVIEEISIEGEGWYLVKGENEVGTAQAKSQVNVTGKISAYFILNLCSVLLCCIFSMEAI